MILGAVALRKESVDRKIFLTLTVRNVAVALRKESVDRKSTYVTRLPRAQVSLSARRAWIENKTLGLLGWLRVLSLSARRAWIENYGA